MNNKHIYPEIWHLLIENGNTHERVLRLKTYLRVIHEGKYYLQRHYRETSWGEKIFSTDEAMEAFKRFIRDVYMTQIYGKVNLNLMRDDNGIMRPLFELDPDQRSEAERLNPQK
jgi:hypothetical protein